MVDRSKIYQSVQSGYDKKQLRAIGRLGKIMRVYKEYEMTSYRHGTLILRNINGVWLFDVTEMQRRNV